MDEDYEHDCSSHGAAPAGWGRGLRWSWMRLVAVGIQATSNIIEEVGEALDYTATLVMQHAIYTDNQREMAAQAAWEIEQLSEGQFYVIGDDELDDELHEVVDDAGE